MHPAPGLLRFARNDESLRLTLAVGAIGQFAPDLGHFLQHSAMMRSPRLLRQAFAFLGKLAILRGRFHAEQTFQPEGPFRMQGWHFFGTNWLVSAGSIGADQISVRERCTLHQHIARDRKAHRKLA